MFLPCLKLSKNYVLIIFPDFLFRSVFIELELGWDGQRLGDFRHTPKALPYTLFRLGVSEITTHKLPYRNDMGPRDVACPLCKVEIEDEHMYFSSAKLLPTSERKCQDLQTQTVCQGSWEIPLRQLLD